MASPGSELDNLLSSVITGAGQSSRIRHPYPLSGEVRNMAEERVQAVLVSDHKATVLAPGTTTAFEFDEPTDFVPVQCDDCGHVHISRGRNMERLERRHSQSRHTFECPGCDQMIEGTMDYHQDSDVHWQPVDNDTFHGGTPVAISGLGAVVDEIADIEEPDPPEPRANR